MAAPTSSITERTVFDVECSCGRRWRKNTREEADVCAAGHEEWHRKYDNPEQARTDEAGR